MDKELKARLTPLALTAGVVAADQLSKWAITQTVRPWTIGASFFGDFFQIVRVYNPAIAFSIGSDLSSDVRRVLFGLLPLVGIAVVLVLYFKSKEMRSFHRWCLAGVVGGGIGNLIDRFFRPEGVLDFLDFKFYGILGFDRWPTFNLADASIVVAGALLLLSLFRDAGGAKGDKEEKRG